MHEVVTISVGHRPNHLTTQFFNCQEQVLCQTKRVNDPSIFLQPYVDKISKTVSYSPRALLWDAKTGSGALGVYQYDQTNDYFYDEDKDNTLNNQSEVVMTHSRIPKSEYQTALDSGSGKLPKLSPEITKYWSDYSKLIYPSTSFNFLREWYHDTSNPNVPDFQKLDAKKFDDYEIGCKEFNENYLHDFFDGNLHSQLEQCDTLQGFNLLTDMDSGWGGFASAILLELRNELPKTSIFSWGFNEDDPLTNKTTTNRDPRSTRTVLARLRNKIRSTVSLSDESDLVIPLYAKPNLSNWEQGGLTCKLFDTVNSLVSQSNLNQRKSLEEITNCFTMSDATRKFVSSISGVDTADSSFFSRFESKDNLKSQHIFNSCFISREVPSPNGLGPSDRELRTYAYYPSDTIPVEYSRETNFTVKLSSTEICRKVFMQYEDVVSKYFRSADDREELKERLGSIKADYEYGWYDDDDSGDDDM